MNMMFKPKIVLPAVRFQTIALLPGNCLTVSAANGSMEEGACGKFVYAPADKGIGVTVKKARCFLIQVIDACVDVERKERIGEAVEDVKGLDLYLPLICRFFIEMIQQFLLHTGYSLGKLL